MQIGSPQIYIYKTYPLDDRDINVILGRSYGHYPVNNCSSLHKAEQPNLSQIFKWFIYEVEYSTYYK